MGMYDLCRALGMGSRAQVQYLPEDFLNVALPDTSKMEYRWQAPRQRDNNWRRQRGRAGHQRADVVC